MLQKIKTALVSLSNKENLELLAEYFIKNNVEVFSTGGTYKALKELGVPVKSVSERTAFPEVMDGRVKSLHPKIHMSLLARAGHEGDASVLKDHEIAAFDLLAVNLYPFKEMLAKDLSEKERVEYIDVGGPSMLRAGAKNFERIVVLSSPSDYFLLNTDKVYELGERKRLAAKVFGLLSDYDRSIAKWMLECGGASNSTGTTEVEENMERKELRYGENPHQKAHWEYDSSRPGLHQAKILQGKALSFNNVVDLTAAVETLGAFSDLNQPTVISVKHNNPCGIGTGKSLLEALKLSLAADPKSVFGGIISTNRLVDLESAEALKSLFLEAVIAPSFSNEAKALLSAKKNLRLLEWKELEEKNFLSAQDFKRVLGGCLVQDFDVVKLDVNSWKQVSGQEDFKEHLQALKFAWKSVARLKSNAISVTNGQQSLGLAMGQVNRVDAVKSAIARWKEFHAETVDNVVLASDAFFPFSDSIEEIAATGIKWIVQPGGSIRDNEVIEAAERLGVNMLFTGKRHFLH